MRWEENFLLWVQSNVRTPFLTHVFQVITHSADKGGIWLLIVLAMLPFESTRRDGAVCLITLLAEAFFVNIVLKHAVGRVRPFHAVEELQPLVRPPDDFSFPSGHTAASFAVAAAVFFAGYRRSAVLLLVFAALVGVSRIYLGVHYLTDVFAGAFIGVLIAYGVHVALGG